MKFKIGLFSFLFTLIFSVVITSPAFAKELNFTDLDSMPWAKDKVIYLAERGIVNGYSETTFGPQDLITRAQATVFLVNALYPNEVAKTANPFSDVQEGLYYSEAIKIAAEKNIISGYEDGSFQPNKRITRGETSSIIDRAFSIEKGNRVVAFTDALGRSEKNIINLASNGIIAGFSDGTFRAAKEISRVEFAVILARTLNPEFIPPVDPFTHIEKEVLRLTNEHRAAHGLQPLILDEKLTQVARLKSKDMIDYNYFDHNSPNYGSPFDMMKHFGIDYQSAAENIAAGYGSPEAVVNGWMNSPGHRANILDSTYTHLGIGYGEGGNYGNYWTQMFMSPQE